MRCARVGSAEVEAQPAWADGFDGVARTGRARCERRREPPLGGGARHRYHRGMRTRIVAVLALSLTACVGGVERPAGPRGGALDATTTAIPRLSRREVDATLLAVLGVRGAAVRNLPADPPVAVSPRTLAEEEVFDTLDATKIPNQVFVEGLESLAFEVAREFSADHARVDALAGCTPSGTPDARCLAQLIETAGLRLWRRPLTEDEVTALVTAASPFATDPGAGTEGHYVAVRMAIASLVQSPELLYLTEIGAPTASPDVAALSNHELAARLSYFLWGSAPSPELLAMAEGPTWTEAQLAAQVDAMLADPRSDAQMRTFHESWLRYRNALVSDPALSADMLAESDALLDRALSGDAPWTTLFDARETFVTPALAAHYGLPVPASASWVPYGSEVPRAGILSHGSFLSLSATRGTETLPSRRGAMLARRILCETILPPPANVDIDDGVAVEEGACKADAYEAHRSRGSCRGCHAVIDGLGFGFERFDGLGRYREVEEANASCGIDGLGSYEGTAFTGPSELASVTEEAITACGVEHLMRFAYRDPVAARSPAREARLLDAFAASGHDFRALVRALALDPSFRQRVSGPMGELP